jgi:hypothetical protein
MEDTFGCSVRGHSVDWYRSDLSTVYTKMA